VISETIEVNAGEAIAALDDLAAAAEETAAKWAEAMAKIDSGMAGMGAGGGGPDKLVAQWDAAASAISADIDKITEAAAKLGDLSASGGGADKLAAQWDSAAGDITASIDKIAESSAKLGDTGAADAAAAGPARLAEAWDSAAGDITAAQAKIADSSDAAVAAQARLADATTVTGARQADMAVSGSAAADANAAIADSATAAAVAQERQSVAAKQAAKDAEESAKKYEMLALGGAAVAGYGIYKASQLQQQVTRLYTSAGESQKNLPMITQGILGMAGPAATSASNLAQGAYWVESGGYHGAQALSVLKAAAQGAYAEGAQTPDVANALTTLLTDYYGGPAKTGAAEQTQAVQAMNAIMATVGQGKMTLQGLSTAMPMLLPTAKTAGLSLPQIFGAEATMTGGGMSAEQSALDIRHAITSLQKPTNVQAAEQQMLGINPVQLSHDLGKQGLTGTIAEVDQAIQKHMGAGGMVMLDTLNQSKLAAQSANEEIAAMPPALQATAKAYLDGSVSAKQWNQEIFSGSESAKDKNLLQQFAATANLAMGFSTLVKSGLGDKQTQVAALNAALGGQTGSQVAQMLGGAHMGTFRSDVDKVGESVQHTGENIRGWSQVQDTLNYKLKSFEYTLESLATEGGQALLPAATHILGAMSDVGQFFAGHAGLTKAAAGVGGVLGAGYLLQKVESPLMTSLQGVGKIAETLNIPGLSKLSTIGQGASGAAADAASAGLDKVGPAAAEAAAGLSKVGGAAAEAAAGEDAAGAAGDKAAAGMGAAGAAGDKMAAEEDILLGVPGGKAGGAAAAEEETAAAEGIGGTSLLSMMKGAGGTVLGTLLLATVADQVLQSQKNSHGNWLDNAFGTPSKSGWNNWGSFFSDVEHMWGLNQSKPGEPSTGTADPGYGRFGPAGSTHPLPRPEAAHPAVSRWTSVTGGMGGQAAPPVSGVDASKFAVPPPPEGGYTAQPGYGRFGPVAGPPGHPELTTPSGPSGSTADLLGTGGHPFTVTASVKVDTSSADSAKSKVTADLNQISQAATSLKPVKFPAPDLSPFSAAKGPATADGAAVSSGFAAGILAGEGAAVAAASAVAGAAAAAMSTKLVSHSPSEVTKKIGVDFTTGFASGLDTGTSAVKASAQEIGSNSVASLIEGLEGGTSNIQSATQALLGQLANPDAVTQIQQTILELQQDVSGDSGLVKWLTAQGNKLQTLANEQGQLMSEISSAQSIASNQVSSSSILNAAAYTPAMAQGPQSAYSTLTGLGYMAGDDRQFAQQLAQLQAEGLSPQYLSQLAQGGASAGLPITAGLVGNKSAISQANAYESQILKASQSIGGTGGVAEFQATAQITAGIATALKTQLKGVDEQMAKIAGSVIDVVEGKTKSSSSSSSASSSSATSSAAVSSSSATAAVNLGKLGPAGSAAAAGMDKAGAAGDMAAAGLDKAAAAAGAFASAMAKASAAMDQKSSPSSSGTAPHGGGGGLMPSGGGGTGGGTVHVTHVHNYNIQGSLIHQNDLADAVQQAVWNKNANDWQIPVPMLPGR
jgi:hypothetical protein